MGCFWGAGAGLSGPVSRCFGVVRVWGPGWAGPRRRRGAGGDRGAAFGAGHLFQREGFELGGQCAQPPGVGEPGGVGAVLGYGSPSAPHIEADPARSEPAPHTSAATLGDKLAADGGPAWPQSADPDRDDRPQALSDMTAWLPPVCGHRSGSSALSLRYSPSFG